MKQVMLADIVKCKSWVHFRVGPGVLSPPLPYELAFPTFNMGVPPLGFVSAPPSNFGTRRLPLLE